ncbi:MAG: pilus assembly protein TadG-related protein [Aquabacterium sp.]
MHKPAPSPLRRAPDLGSRQRGVGLVGTVTMLMALLFTTLALDTARLWLEKRNLQRVADMAAMASSRFTGCGSSYSDALTSAQQAVAGNAMATPGSGITVNLVRGKITAVNGLQSFAAAAEPTDGTNGTRVVLRRSVPKSLVLRGWEGWSQVGGSGGNFDIEVTSVARGGPPLVAFSLGSKASDISTDQASFLNNLFGALFGTRAPTVTPDGYEGLFGLSLDLNSLMQATGATSLQQLLDTPMPPNVLIQAVLSTNPNMPGATRAALQSLLSSANGSSSMVTLRQVLDIQSVGAG